MYYEGEFASLVRPSICSWSGAGGELPANPRPCSANGASSHRIQSFGRNDLYELRLPDRRRFARLFLESLIHLPRELWRPTLIVLDEAHIYCPERGSGEAESAEAVIGLVS